MAKSFEFLAGDNYERNYFLIPEVQCGDPGDPVNATVVRRSGSFKFGHSIMYECNTDHVPCRGDSYIQCNSDGHWSDVPLSCGNEVMFLGHDEHL